MSVHIHKLRKTNQTKYNNSDDDKQEDVVDRVGIIPLFQFLAFLVAWNQYIFILWTCGRKTSECFESGALIMPLSAFLDWETAVSCIIAPCLPKIFPVISHLTDGHGLVHSPAGLSGGQDSDTAD